MNNDLGRCRMSKCNMIPMFRYTWPGQDEKFACMAHSLQLSSVAEVMGFHLQMIPLKPEEMEKHSCTQNVKEEG
jgi:hypothetical protein